MIYQRNEKDSERKWCETYHYQTISPVILKWWTHKKRMKEKKKRQKKRWGRRKKPKLKKIKLLKYQKRLDKLSCQSPFYFENGTYKTGNKQ